MSILNEKRYKIIKAAIPFILEQGWNENAMGDASTSLQEDQNYWKLFFPNILAVVEYFESIEDMRMLSVMEKQEKIEGIRNKIGRALLDRIVKISGGQKMLVRLHEFYSKGIRAISQNLPSAGSNIWHSADIIWGFAGDNSTDFNYYTKRMLLSGVYMAVVKKCLQEDLDSQVSTSNIEQYITDSLNKVVKWGGRLGKLKSLDIEDMPILRLFC